MQSLLALEKMTPPFGLLHFIYSQRDHLDPLKGYPAGMKTTELTLLAAEGFPVALIFQERTDSADITFGNLYLINMTFSSQFKLIPLFTHFNIVISTWETAQSVRLRWPGTAVVWNNPPQAAIQ